MRHTAYHFHSRTNAFAFAARAARPMRIILGDDDMFWVVCPADAAYLERRGYEYAK